MSEHEVLGTLRDRLGVWAEEDVAEYALARVLGVLADDVEYATEAKHVFWTNNELGVALMKILDILVEIGALERDAEGVCCRWNKDFAWKDVSGRRPRNAATHHED